MTDAPHQGVDAGDQWWIASLAVIGGCALTLSVALVLMVCHRRRKQRLLELEFAEYEDAENARQNQPTIVNAEVRQVL